MPLMVRSLARSWYRPAAAVPLLAAVTVALHACSWIEWAEEPLVGEALPPAATAEAPPPEPGFTPAKPPPPRPAPPPAVAAAPPPVEGRHTVKRGETLFSIARLYDVDTYTLASRNRLRPPYTLEAGQVLAVPRAEATAAPVVTAPAVEVSPLAPTGATAQPLPPVRPPSASADGGASRTTTTAADAVRPPPVGNEARAGFLWPVSGEVVRGFGPRQDGSRSDGIDIRVKRPTAVRAARQGRVHYAGNQLKSYGNIVLIAHDDQWWTLYAHVDEILISENDMVKQGDIIARITSASEAQPAILHFEVRDRTKKPVDPMRHLPRQRV
jgi:murein DD-endopeptidase MepM/ murein hydrolase activator NlpD